MRLPKEVIAEIAKAHLKSTHDQAKTTKMALELQLESNVQKGKKESEQSKKIQEAQAASQQALKNQIIHARKSASNYNEAFTNLHKKWKELHEEREAALSLSTIIDLYKQSKKVCDYIDKKNEYQGIARTKVIIQNALFKKAVAKNFLIFPSLEHNSFVFKKTTLETLEALLIVDFFKNLEILYKNLKENEKTDLINNSFGDLFWEKATELLNTLSEPALKKLKCDLISKDPIMLELLNKFVPTTVIKRLCIQTRKVNMFRNICLELNVQFLQYFDQEKNPFVYFGGKQCIGLTSAWALHLYQNPPRDTGRKTPGMLKLDTVLKTLKGEELPKEWPLTYFLMGEEPAFNKNTYLFQYQYLPTLGEKIFSETERTTNDLKGESVTKLAQELFSNAPLSIVAVILNTINDTALRAHMIGIAQIRLSNQKTVYRVVDSNLGECEIASFEQLAPFLNRYFAHMFYPHLFCKSTLFSLDSALRLHCQKSQMETKKGAERKAVDIKSNWWIPHADFLPAYPRRRQEEGIQEERREEKQEGKQGKQAFKKDEKRDNPQNHRQRR